MKGNIVKISYIKSFLKQKINGGIAPEEAKKLCRKEIMDTLSRLPQMVYDQLLHYFPVPGMDQHLVVKALFGASKYIPWDKSHWRNIQKELPSKEILQKDVRVMYDRIQNEYLKRLQPLVSKQVMKHIQKKIKEFLETRNRGIDIVYTYKDHPEHLLRKLLKGEEYREDEKDILEMQQYLADNQAKIYVDHVYGAIYLSLSTALAKKYIPESGGKFMRYLMSNEPVISSQEFMQQCYEITQKYEQGEYTTKDVYKIIVGSGSAITRIHETQHLANSLIMAQKDDQDFWERGKDEILAYIKAGVKIKDVLNVIHSETYGYYQKEAAHIQHIIQRRKEFIKENENKVPGRVIENSKKSLTRNEKRLTEYQTKNLPLRNDYVSTIDDYIRMAYVFKKSSIENRLELLMLTPIRQRPKLLEMYDIEQ